MRDHRRASPAQLNNGDKLGYNGRDIIAGWSQSDVLDITQRHCNMAPNLHNTAAAAICAHIGH